MRDDRAKYVTIETAINVAVNVAFSLLFVQIIFHGMRYISRAQLRLVVLDSIPQTFVVSMMSVVVPIMLLRRRRQAGGLLWLPPRRDAAARLYRPAAAIAWAATVVGFALHTLLISRVFPDGMTHGTLLFLKAAYGAVVAAVVTPVAFARELKDEVAG